MPRVLAALCAATLWLWPCLGSSPAHAQSAAVAECIRFSGAEFDISNQEAFRKALKAWQDNCQQALAAEPSNPRVQVAAARSLTPDGRWEEAMPLLRAAAAAGDAEANYEIYERYKSYDRSDPAKRQLVTRAEAEQGLRKAAELGHPYSMWILAVLLDRGSTVKRDPAQAIYWAEKAMAKPPKDTQPIDIQIRLGHFLTKSAKPEERARGIRILEAASAQRNRGDAKAYLARAIRADDPVRARTLLIEAERTFPGHAIPALADMLIKGEGGPKDEKRALALLQGRRASDVGAVKAALGDLHLEGRLLPRNVAEAVGLIRLEAVWSLERLVQVMGLIAANPEVRLANPGSFLYDATEAAELGEPGAREALIALKLSQNAQFADKAGGCRLVERAVQAGDTAAGKYLPQCRAN